MRGSGVLVALGQTGERMSLYVVGELLSLPSAVVVGGQIDAELEPETWTDDCSFLGPCAIASVWMAGRKLKVLVPLAVLGGDVCRALFADPDHPARRLP